MQPLGVNEIRELYLSFFEKKEHLRLKSFPLIPHNDKSLLLINSGMAPLKPYFTGQEVPPNKRVTTCQKCIRTGDIENVGKTTRHGTFFEMLGCFSFGDYFKEEIIKWSYEFYTQVIKLPLEKLYISVYKDDNETYEIWNKKVGIPKEKIVRLGKEDNFWEVGVGPCGPSSELYYDRGESYACGKESCTVGCDCDRYIEFWNLVFTQYNKEEDGSYTSLKITSIDTGMGLERMAVIMQDVFSLFDIDTIKDIRDEVCKIAKVRYGENDKADISIRIITDHIRSIAFMTADGVLPSNEGRGYILRRLLRRAVRHGKILGINNEFLSKLCRLVIQGSKDAYPELIEKSEYIFKVISVEESRFYETLDQGMEMLKEIINEAKNSSTNIISGSHAFKMYDTFGFPVELMEEILEEENLTINDNEFEQEMEKQRKRGRAAREEYSYSGAEDTIYDTLNPLEYTQFLGYNNLEIESNIKTIIYNNTVVESAVKGMDVSIILDKTSIYAESGGQRGDKGIIKTDDALVIIEDCIKVTGNKFAHIGKVVKGKINVGDTVVVSVDKVNRMATTRNHTATHLLHKALKDVLGNHVEQAGSDVSPHKLRFDFTHFSPLTNEELVKIEEIVNGKILESLDTDLSEKNINEAKAMGAVALFGEKYSDIVRVLNIDNYSIELCGGTHVKNTSQIGTFKIISENGVAAGIRRIEAVTGLEALNYYNKQNNTLKEVSALFKETPENLVKKSEDFLRNYRNLKSELEKVNSKITGNMLESLLVNMEVVQNKNIFITRVDKLDMNALRNMGDQVKDKIKTGIIVLIGEKDNKVNIVVMATDDMVKQGIHAGNLIKELASITGGKGGGRPNMAQAGGKDVSKIDEALKEAKEIILKQLQT